jgi:hypothetical protein
VKLARHSGEPQILRRRTGSGPVGEQLTQALWLKIAAFNTVMIGPMIRAFGADDVAGPTPVQKTTFSDDR